MIDNAFIELSRFVKQSDEVGDSARQQAARAIPQIGLAALGIGAAARGGVGLYNLLQQHLSPQKPKYPAAITTELPIPVQDDREKHADITDISSVPWLGPVGFGVGALGMAGGWKGVDYLLKKQQQNQDQAQLDSAKKDFEGALLDSYSRPRQLGPGGYAKAAGDLSDALDQLFDKQAWTLDDVLGKLQSGYGMWAVSTGVPAAYWAYQRENKNSERSSLQKAMDQRTRRAYATRPSEIYATPKLVEQPRSKETAGLSSPNPGDSSPAPQMVGGVQDSANSQDTLG